MDTSIQGEEILLLITVGILIMLILVFSLIAFFLLSQQKIQKSKQKAFEIALEQREQRLYGNIQIQENERQRIAKDLHDSIGSKLNVLNLSLHGLKQKIPSNPEITETVRGIFDLIDNTLETTRRISHDLLPPTLEKFGLEAALSELCSQIDKGSNSLKAEFDTDDLKYIRQEKMVELNLFRVVQELCSNSIKYGSVSHIKVQLLQLSTELHLTYQDNGIGFNPDAAEFKPGLGLQNINSRLIMIGAEHELKTAPGEGVQFFITYLPKP